MRNLAKASFLTLVISVLACSSANLRKFDDGDLAKGLPAEFADKFEVKDVGTAKATPTPSPSPAPETALKKSRKGKKAKKEAVAQATPTPAPTIAPVVSPMRRPEKLPFDVGEKLEYGIRYVGVTAAHFAIEVQPLKQVADRKVFHFTGHAKTVKIFELVYRVDDELESFWDYDGLYSHRYTMDMDESKQTRKAIEVYDYEKKKSYFWNRVDHVEKGYKEEKQSYDIEPWSQDPISSLYYLRSVKLPTDPQQEFRFPVVLDGKPWELVLKYKKQEKIYAGQKDRLADVYSFDTIQGGQVKNKDNTVWISADEHRYILRLEAKVKVGSFAIALDKVL